MINKEIEEALSGFKREYESCNHNSSDLIIELEIAEIILQYIEQLENKVKELETTKTMQEYRINEMDIPKQVIRDKIEELDKAEKEIYKKDIGNNELYRLKIIDEIRSVLQELLEEGEKEE